MKAIKLTDQQRKALDLNRNIAVVAGAGSGKTLILVERYLAALEQDPDLAVRDVLAITFTRKAAAQMRQRVAQGIAKRVKAASSTDPKRWLRARDELLEAQVSTIHSFCAALLREHASSAGIDPDFAVVGDLVGAAMPRESVDETLRKGFSKEDPELAEAARCASIFGSGTLGDNLDHLLTNREIAGRFFARLSGKNDEECLGLLRDAYENFLTELGAAIEWAAVDDALRMLARFAEEGGHPEEASPLVNAAAGMVRQDSQKEKCRALLGLRPILLTQQGKPRKRVPGEGRKNWPGREREREAYRESFSSLSTLLATIAPQDVCFDEGLELRTARLLRSYAVLFRAATEEYERRKTDTFALDYDDLEERTAGLLEQDAALRDSVRRRYKHILIDEFQDVNDHQWRIAELLLADSRHAGKALIVGDERQSIYGFRGAKKEVFSKARTELSEANRRDVEDGSDALVQASESFRTLSPVLSFINDRFGGAFGSTYEPLAARRDDCQKAGKVEVLVGERPEELIAKRIRAGVEGSDADILWVVRDSGVEAAKYKDFAILIRARSVLPRLENALVTYGVPYFVHAGVGLYERKEVQDLLNVLRFLADERDEIALAGVLRSPLIGVTDETLYALSMIGEEGLWRKLVSLVRNGKADDLPAWGTLGRAYTLLETWKSIAHRAPVASLLDRVCAETGFWATLSVGRTPVQNVANVERLIDVAGKFDREASGSAAEFVAVVDRLVEQGQKEPEAAVESAGNAVQVMTIHAAKGLEFNIAVVPDLDVKQKTGGQPSMLVHRDIGLGPKVLGDDGMTNSFLRTAIRERKKTEEREEEKRVAYVSHTRARDNLIIWTRKGKDDSTSWWRENDNVRVCADDSFDYVQPVESVEGNAVCDVLEKGALNRGPDDETFSELSSLASVPRQPIITPTHLVTYAECPRWYFMQYVMGVPEGWMQREADAVMEMDELAEAGIRDEPSQFGVAAHRALELYVKGRARGSPVAEVLETSAERAAAECGRNNPRLRDKLRRVLEEFERSHIGRRALRAKGPLCEHAFTLAVEDVFIRGTIDLLCKGEAADWHIVDYKTVEVETDERGDLDIDEVMNRYSIQLDAYALAAFSLQECSSVTTSLYLTRYPDKLPPVAEYTRDERPRLVQNVLSLAKEMIAGGENIDAFARRVGKPCARCPYDRLGLCSD